MSEKVVITNLSDINRLSNKDLIKTYESADEAIKFDNTLIISTYRILQNIRIVSKNEIIKRFKNLNNGG